MSKIEVNKIGPQCGTTLTVGCGSGQTVTVDANTVTLGRSGGTVSIASGATTSGMGRTGTVDWDTTPKTAAFTAVSGNGYFVDTSSAAITVTLPASPSAGDIVAVADYTRTWNTNNCTLGRNSENIGGVAADAVLSINGQSVTFVYVDSTEGWINVNDAKESTAGTVDFMAATGGTVTTCGDFKVHTFTGPGTFCVSQVSTVSSDRNNVAYMVIAGGGGSNASIGGGGGAGGYREGRCSTTIPYTASPKAAGTGVVVSAISYPITVGAGGAGQAPSGPTPSASGSNSVFSTITSAGGGKHGTSGGSGGGGGHQGAGGAGNTPPVSPPQGNAGGNNSDQASPGPSTGRFAGAGGGGASAVGTQASCAGYSSASGAGGAGTPSEINGTATTRAGGGGGGAYGTPAPAPGGSGGGGAGGGLPQGAGSNGSTNTGGGGGGGGASSPSGGSGGSGIVILRYKFQ